MADVEQIPGELNIEIVQGDDLSLQFSIDENLSGYSCYAAIHVLNGGSVTGQTAISSGTSLSWIQVDFSATITAALEVTGDDGAHNWKLVTTDTAGSIRTLVKGSFTVLTGI